MTRLFLIRHAETIDEDSTKVFKGTIDIPLSETGIARIKAASQFMSRFHLDFIYTSALSRCIESGKIIAEPHGLQVQVVEGLNELHFGLWEGLSFEEVQERYSEELKAWLGDLEEQSPPGGETLREARKRVMKAFYDVAEAHAGQTGLVVAHAGVLRIIVSSILDLPASHIFRIAQDYGCINIVDIYKNNTAVIKLLNFTFYV